MSNIHLHHRSIASIIQLYGVNSHHQPDDGFTTPAQQRLILRQYRQDTLVKFCENLGLNRPTFGKTGTGKPICTNIDTLHFSQSHTKEHYALVWTNDNSRIGVDLESLDRKVNFSGMAQRYFSQNEQRYWQNSPNKVHAWFEIWTAKEAVLKAHGLGIRLRLAELDTKADKLMQQGMAYHPKIGRWFYQAHILKECRSMVAIASGDLAHIIL
ncbi:4'-phosphopantetheinyl transferase superfamily protein [Moraxella nasovis]|uniref:4'-phosphopantetheinyl transferase family protein n=1 Tax=Moraxella nasovis TaxID=2904121 RepID=UPI001F607E77|nr:4'-phosphopantetheinyl transferase superfamily protein [Moraxella nasovis]UNU73117.1 4'-phosphopantetheinyl transferase superfamily protein [Moraxella nasovis]